MRINKYFANLTKVRSSPVACKMSNRKDQNPSKIHAHHSVARRFPASDPYKLYLLAKDNSGYIEIDFSTLYI